MRSFNIGFFSYIERFFGVEAKVNLKRWSRIHISIIKTREKIFFSKKCKRLKLLPQHLSFSSNYISLIDHRSVTSYNNLRFRTAFRILNIELSDTHRYLRHLRYNELHLARYLFDFIPRYILENFFKRQFHFFH